MSTKKVEKEQKEVEKDPVQPEPEQEETSTDGLKDIKTAEQSDKELENIVDDMPEVNPEAVNASQDEQSPVSQQTKNIGITDRYNRAFNPEIHGTDPQGNPLLTRDGNLRIVKRKAGGGINIPQNGQAGLAPQFQDAQLSAKRRYSAEMVANIFIQTTVGLFGEEWKPEKSSTMDEKEFLVTSTDDYFKDAGFVEPPAWAVLIVAYGTYSLKRFNQPRTRTVFQKIKEGLGKKFMSMRKKKGVNRGSHSDTGNNGERKDDAGVPSSPSV